MMKIIKYLFVFLFLFSINIVLVNPSKAEYKDLYELSIKMNKKIDKFIEKNGDSYLDNFIKVLKKKEKEYGNKTDTLGDKNYQITECLNIISNNLIARKQKKIVQTGFDEKYILDIFTNADTVEYRNIKKYKSGYIGIEAGGQDGAEICLNYYNGYQKLVEYCPIYFKCFSYGLDSDSCKEVRKNNKIKEPEIKKLEYSFNKADYELFIFCKPGVKKCDNKINIKDSLRVGYDYLVGNLKNKIWDKKYKKFIEKIDKLEINK